MRVERAHFDHRETSSSCSRGRKPRLPPVPLCQERRDGKSLSHAFFHVWASVARRVLRKLKFDGPVIEFVQQKNECLDGSGYPQGISGDEIHQESRILSVANAFVAMTSSRAYRSGKPIKEVLDILMSEADSRYDRHVIAALFHVAENHADWDSWQQVK